MEELHSGTWYIIHQQKVSILVMGIILNIVLQNIQISGYQLCLLYSQSHDITTKLTEKRFENCYRSAYTEFEFLVIILILS